MLYCINFGHSFDWVSINANTIIMEGTDMENKPRFCGAKGQLNGYFS